MIKRCIKLQLVVLYVISYKSNNTIGTLGYTTTKLWGVFLRFVICSFNIFCREKTKMKKRDVWQSTFLMMLQNSAVWLLQSNLTKLGICKHMDWLFFFLCRIITDFILFLGQGLWHIFSISSWSLHRWICWCAVGNAIILVVHFDL